jgi:tetratricopeptide (TPR) repeat protein
MDLIRSKVGHGLDDATLRNARPLAEARLGRIPIDAVRVLADDPAEALASLHIDARAHLVQALQLDPTAVRPRVLLCLIELRDQRFAEAEQIIGALVREQPHDPDHLALYADLRLRLLDLPKSKELTARALRIDPEHVEARRVALLLDLVSGEHSAAEQSSLEQRLARVIEHSPDTAQVSFMLFQSLVERHHLAEAIRLGHALQRVQPQNTALDNALIDLRVFTHPLGVPLYQMRRVGWLGLVILGFVVVAIYQLVAELDATLGTAFVAGCALLVAYAWLYPAWMRAWYRDQAS